ncbi:MAG: hypothetical protein ACXW3L_11880, partial [Limisphaerales bacterium]
TQEDNFVFGGALILVRDPRLVYRILELALTNEWQPGSATWYLRNIGASSGHPMLAREFILQNFDQVLAKASIRARPQVMPDAYRGFNESRQADDLLSVQRRLLGENAMTPAEQVAESIRHKAAVLERNQRTLPRLLEALTNRQPMSERRLATAAK